MNDVSNINLRFIFTGSPGAGKSTAAELIEFNSNIYLVKEAAARLLLEAKDAPMSMQKQMKKVKHIQAADINAACKRVEIFDRTLVDSLIYDSLYTKKATEIPPDLAELRDAMQTRHAFSPYVFLFALSDKKEDYKLDDSDSHLMPHHTYEEAVELQHKLIKGYQKLGYHVHLVPWMNAAKRAQMVTERIFEAIEASHKLSSMPNFCLHQLAQGANDEGLAIMECVNKIKQISASLSVALDRPFVDGISFDDLRAIKAANGYSIKEEAIDHFNEKQVNLAYSLILHHYIKNAQALVGKSREEPATIIIQTFRGGDGPSHLELLKQLLDIATPELNKQLVSSEGSDLSSEAFRYYFPDCQVTAIFTFGKADLKPEKSVYTDFKTSATFSNADIILAFSSHAGLEPEWGPGTLVIPTDCTPLNVSKMEIDASKCYQAENHLLKAIKSIVACSQEEFLRRINKNYQSKNASKIDQQAAPLTEKDFKLGHFLELGGYIFTPQNAPYKSFRVINSQ